MQPMAPIVMLTSQYRLRFVRAEMAAIAIAI